MNEVCLEIQAWPTMGIGDIGNGKFNRSVPHTRTNFG